MDEGDDEAGAAEEGEGVEGGGDMAQVLWSRSNNWFRGFRRRKKEDESVSDVKGGRKRRGR